MRLSSSFNSARNAYVLTAIVSFCALLSIPLRETPGQLIEVAGSATGLTSTADRMISYQHQRHLWQTDDDAVHVLLNRGALSLGAPMALYTTFDGGNNWTSTSALPSGNQYTTSDGILTGSTLTVVYSDLFSNIRIVALGYDSATKHWSRSSTELVASDPLRKLVNPTFAYDSSSRIWCTYVRYTPRPYSVSIRLSYKQIGSPAWTDTNLNFGDVGIEGIRRSARLVRLPAGVGMIFTVEDTLFWAWRLNEWPENAPWNVSTIFVGQKDIDPYSSHFSLADDGLGNLHLATVDGGRVLYSRLFSGDVDWQPIVELAGFENTNYVQTSLSNGNVLVLGSNNNSTKAYRSIDGGSTFYYSYLLSHQSPPADGSISYDLPRLTAPETASERIPVLQQFRQSDAQSLLFFSPTLSIAAPE